MSDVKNHIVIIGGGHVGLSFALLLAHRGIKSTLLEKVAYPTISPSEDTQRQYYLDCRNTALSRRTVQIYTQIGLWDKLSSHACRIDKVLISELGGFGQATLDKHAEKVESFGVVMENAWFGRVLLQAVKANSLITLIDKTNVTDIHQNEAGVTVSALTDSNSTPLTLSASLVVACDGQHSPSRQLLGVGVDTHDYRQVGIVGVVETDKAHNHVAIERFSTAGPLAVLPLTDNGDIHRRSVVFICPKGEEQRYLDDDEYFLATLQNVFGNQAGTFIKAGKRGAYPLTKVLAHRQVVGRCVLMGNAVHTLHPVAGQGFNLCLRDAHALANLLGENLAHGIDFGNTSRLQQYAKSRQKDQHRVIKFCDTVVGSFTSTSSIMKLARNVGLVAFDKVPFIKPMVATYAMGLKS
ncbi:FAD-dependent monooxygenase [Moraxella oblonga]|uniref:FAD-dependent monooxygenase n=1 Tax=Moraxella oblonga TaxID=200413 RepID=UPI00082CEEA3|nr:FAD-dependent monooxygenase [Moraxella oblonga]